MVRYAFAFVLIAAATTLALLSCSSFETAPATVDANEATTPDSAGDATDPSVLFHESFEGSIGCGRFEVKNGTAGPLADGGRDGSGACRICRGAGQYLDFWAKNAVVADPGEYEAQGWLRLDRGKAYQLNVGFLVRNSQIERGPNVPADDASFQMGNYVYTVVEAGTKLAPGVFAQLTDAGPDFCVDVDDVILRKH